MQIKYFANQSLDDDINKLDGDPKYAKFLNELTEKKMKVSLENKNIGIRELARMLEEKELNLAPGYQRGFVWKSERCARLVETALAERFIPPVVFHEKADGNFDVIDGKQRLSTLLAFHLGPSESKRYNFPAYAATLQPEKTDEGTEHPLHGLRFEDLPDRSKKFFKNYNIHVKIVPKTADDELVFAIYEDINSGGEDLTAQQLRRAVYFGDYMNLIDTLRKECQSFKNIRGENTECNKESDGEMILRAFAFSNVKPSEYKSPLKTFLNKDASNINHKIKSLSEDERSKKISFLKKRFESICEIILDIFGGEVACRELDIKSNLWRNKPSPWLFETIYMVINDMMDEDSNNNRARFQKSASMIKSAIEQSFRDSAFEDCKGLSKGALIKRYEILKNLFKQALSSENGQRDYSR